MDNYKIVEFKITQLYTAVVWCFNPVIKIVYIYIYIYIYINNYVNIL